MMNRPVSELLRDRTPPVLPPGATVREACQRMRERHSDCVLVAEGRGRLLGIFTERDAVWRVLAEGRDADRATLAEAATRDPVTMRPEGTAMEALRLMQDGGFRHVPVVRGERPVGVVAFTDFSGQEHTRLEDETETFERLR